jgi:ATP-dependent Clp protease ATP-binding subunit ClpA
MARIQALTNYIPISGDCNLPARSLHSKEIYDKLKVLDQTLKEKHIFGQDPAVDAIVKLIKLGYAGLRDENKPLAVILLSGPTGTGKTELSKQLSKELNKHFIRFDMSEYQEKVSVTKLFGSAPGYAGFEQGGQLVNAIRANPNSVLLIDEIDKAHPDIYNVLLQIFDYATLTDNQGLKADFRNVIIILTSNAGAKEIGKKRIGFGDQIYDDRAVDHALERMFSPEFRNRIDLSISFNQLTPDIITSIVYKEIEMLKTKLLKKKIILCITDDCIEKLADESYNCELGARQVHRLIDQHIKTLLVDEILFGSLSKGGSVKIDLRDGVYCMEIEEEGCIQKIYRKTFMTFRNMEDKKRFERKFPEYADEPVVSAEVSPY